MWEQSGAEGEQAPVMAGLPHCKCPNPTHRTFSDIYQPVESREFCESWVVKETFGGEI